MKSIFYFYLFLLYRIHYWAQRSGELGSQFIACAFWGIVIFANIVTVIDFVGLLRGHSPEYMSIPEVERSPMLFGVIFVYCLVCYGILLKTGILKKSRAMKSEYLYTRFRFKNMHAVIYVVVSFVALFGLAFLK